MFTGIVTDIGEIASLTPTAQGQLHRLRIACRYDRATIADGASIACNGVCLTVIVAAAGEIQAEVGPETIRVTTLGSLAQGAMGNLERPLRVGDEFGGHIVTGHIDGIADAVGKVPEGESVRMTFQAPVALARFIAEKGSIALDGVSLTVNEVDGARFGINIIPHTAKVTTFGRLKPGGKVNLEIDLLARYVARLVKG